MTLYVAYTYMKQVGTKNLSERVEAGFHQFK